MVQRSPWSKATLAFGFMASIAMATALGILTYQILVVPLSVMYSSPTDNTGLAWATIIIGIVGITVIAAILAYINRSDDGFASSYSTTATGCMWFGAITTFVTFLFVLVVSSVAIDNCEDLEICCKVLANLTADPECTTPCVTKRGEFVVAFICVVAAFAFALIAAALGVAHVSK